MNLRAIVLGAAAALAIAVTPADAQRRPKTPKTPKPLITVPVHTTKIGTYTAGSLEGQRLGGLYASYLALDPHNPAIDGKVEVDFCSVLTHLWQGKARRSHDKIVTKHGQRLVNAYCARRDAHTLTRMTLDEFVTHADASVTMVRDGLDWNGYGAAKRLTLEETSDLKQLTNLVNGRDMLAYMMTELFPLKDGEINTRFTEFLLRNAGLEFFDGIPAMGDKYLSRGPYQFTKLALAPNTRTATANVPNAFLNGSAKIPETVAELKPKDHVRAAYLFLIENTANLINRLSDKQLKTLLATPGHARKVALLEFAAATHNRPKSGYEMMGRWLDNNRRFSIERSADRWVIDYVSKTAGNLAELYNDDGSPRAFNRFLYDTTTARH